VVLRSQEKYAVGQKKMDDTYLLLLHPMIPLSRTSEKGGRRKRQTSYEKGIYRKLEVRQKKAA
jgi:hypothetical protein